MKEPGVAFLNEMGVNSKLDNHADEIKLKSTCVLYNKLGPKSFREQVLYKDVC
jgi:hypothetical protein